MTTIMLLKMQTNLLSIEDLKGCADFAIRREGRLNTKQIRVLARKANDNIGSQFFWDWFVAKYGVPIPNSRGFAAGKTDGSKSFCCQNVNRKFYNRCAEND